LKAIGAVRSTVFEKNETLIETRYFITTLDDVGKFSNRLLSKPPTQNCTFAKLLNFNAKN
jgi:hypothetical protein